jgi:hypothetical protein
MYYQAVLQYTQVLRNIDSWLDKAEQYAASKKFDVGVLLNSRLAPDMGNFIYQVQSACDYIKGAAAWLSDQAPPRHEDNETTIDALRARIRKTIVFMESVQETRFSGAAEQKIRVSWGPAGTIVGGQDYLLQVSIPNVYFHVMAAYAILRHNGVTLGKMDFLGPINWVEA